MNVGIVDYGGGNIRSVIQAIEAFGLEPRLIDAPGKLDGIDRLLFPGQGSFGSCMKALTERDLTAPVREWISQDRPFLGICIGYQLLFEESEESPGIAGLGVLKGKVIRFPTGELKIPQMGWNSAHVIAPESAAWAGLGPDPYFYFVHSFYPEPADKQVIATSTDYGLSYASAVQQGQLLATQFHPEKSQRAGLRLIGNFLGRDTPLIR